MDAGLQHPTPPRNDPHDWNSLENFVHVHETRLEQHAFVDHAKSNTLRFEEYELDGEVFMVLDGVVYCHHNVVLEVTKIYETRVTQGRRQIRGFSYRYNASIRGRHTILRYDNGHPETPDEFHRHLFRISDGEEIERRIITRYELPTFADILTELQRLFEVEENPSGVAS